MTAPLNDDGLPDLVGRAYGNVLEMGELYVTMAKQEAREDLRSSIRGVAIAGAGAGLIMSAMTAFLIAGISGMSQLTGWDEWIIAVITGVVFLIIAAILIFIGKAMIRTKPLAQTREAVQEGVTWFKEQRAIFTPKSTVANATPPQSWVKSSKG